LHLNVECSRKGKETVDDENIFLFSDRGAGAGLATPDLDDVKESVRQGVSKVAGRLSNMASGVFTSLQVIGTLNNINPVKVLS
jgi:hypothetical protein